ncbi:TM2 domain-containing protein [Verticiella sediminum]|uniref:TM2 domain-containing protein n=1 Tax=Verticiella sediminum TaxID=1247510 RepID=A0A556ABG8_9BURK|nr:TM2 domain-containing protein [Verticiella sediminum]TSH90211.1 TM2 domain-containing protein [Verticiella sediminum]
MTDTLLSATPTRTDSSRGFRHKTLAGLLAFCLGWAGAHGWYLGRRYAWLPLLATATILTTVWLRAAPWHDQLLYYLVLVPLVAGFVEALVLCLMSDERFDARYNASQQRRSRSGWGAVILAMAILLIGMSIIMAHVVVASLAMVDGSLGL